MHFSGRRIESVAMMHLVDASKKIDASTSVAMMHLVDASKKIMYPPEMSTTFGLACNICLTIVTVGCMMHYSFSLLYITIHHKSLYNA